MIFLKNILIVDDSMFMRLSLKNMLESNGYKVVGEAENGKIAIEKYKTLHPDIVTMDITMPEMEGLEALKHIKAYDENCKVVMVSAVGQESNVRNAILYGAKSFIVKPYKEDHILKVLEKL
jgi:two-component system, chemotaxis family, chemotaxis protein CheY